MEYQIEIRGMARDISLTHLENCADDVDSAVAHVTQALHAAVGRLQVAPCTRCQHVTHDGGVRLITHLQGDTAAPADTTLVSVKLFNCEVSW